MSGVGRVLMNFVSPLGTALGLFNKPKKQAAPVMQPTVTPRANSAVMDALSARAGAAANMRTGTGGAESSTGKKTLMGT